MHIHTTSVTHADSMEAVGGGGGQMHVAGVVYHGPGGIGGVVRHVPCVMCDVSQ